MANNPASLPKKPKIAFTLSIISSALILIQGIIRIFRGNFLEISGITNEIRRRILLGLVSEIIGVVALVFAVLIIVGAILLYMYPARKAGVVLVIVFAILGIVSIGLFGFIGLIIGVIAGVVALVWHR